MKNKDRELQLEVFRHETEMYLTEDGKRIMRAIRKYGRGRGDLSYIYKIIRKREAYIATLEEHMLEMEYRNSRLLSKVTLLGECGIPVNVRTMEVLLDSL